MLTNRATKPHFGNEAYLRGSLGPKEICAYNKALKFQDSSLQYFQFRPVANSSTM